MGVTVVTVRTGASGVQDVIADACWFAHRYDARRDEILFVRLPQEFHRTSGFLKNLEIGADTLQQRLPRAVLKEALRDREGKPAHFIFHSGLTCSTLLARALGRSGIATAFNEPPILTDVVAHGLTGNGIANRDVLDVCIALLGRRFAVGEPIIVKVGSVANGLAPAIMARHPATRALALHAPLPVFLASIARRGLWGRLWGRKLFLGLRNAKLVELGFDDADFFQHTDLQIAADAWLAVHAILAEVTRRYGPARLAAIDSERLSGSFADATAAIAAHFGLRLDPAEVRSDTLLGQHSKTGKAFDLTRRSSELDAALRTHGDEIGTVASWIADVAGTIGVPLELPNQLRM